MTNPFTDEQVEALRDEFEFRIRTAVTYGCGKGFRERPVQERADWIQREIVKAMLSRAVQGLSGVASQAEIEDDGLDDCPACDTPLAQCSRGDVCCEDCNHDACWPPEALVLPSSTVDKGEAEHVVEEVIRSLVDLPLSTRLVLARAVVEAIGGEPR